VKRSHSPEWSGRIAAGDIAPRLREAAFWNAKKVAKNLLGEVWLQSRRKIIQRRAENDRRQSS